MQSDQPVMEIEDISSIYDNEQTEMNPLVQLRKFWNLYIPTIPPKNLNLEIPLHKIIWLFHQMTKKSYFKELFKIGHKGRNFTQINIYYPQLLKKLSEIQDEMGPILLQLFENFVYQANNILTALSLILHYTYQSEIKNRVYIPVEGHPLSQMSELRAHMVDNFLSFKSIVLKVYQIKMMALSMKFQCFECKNQIQQFFVDGIYCTPTKCFGRSNSCKGKIFTPIKQSMKCIFIQRIKVQELQPQGRVPRQISCELRQNLVGKIITGQTVTVSGILKTQAAEQKDKKTQGIFTPFLIVNSLDQKSKKSASYNLDKINKMRKNPRIMYSLIKSFCPAIYGHEIVKAGLILGLIGGSSKNLVEQSTFRQTSHILLLGDPGLGKSQLLKFAIQLLPHSIYVNATSVSNSGLTVTINKDNNEQALEAGALILADGGICAIDQFDKAIDSSSLLQVMQQQTVSIAKAGIICQLKCRVGIFASANPVQGCYNKGKTFKQNTKISNAILSRFDLIFLLIDKPDPQRDMKLSQHIMKIHNNNRKKVPGGGLFQQKKYQRTSEYISLNEKYTKQCEIQSTTYTLQDMKEYFTFIRNQIHPILSREAAEILKGFYIALRQNSPSSSFQITNRQLQSLIRLAMARARIEAREQVTEKDALQITSLMQQSLFDSFQQMGYNVNSLKNQVKKMKVIKKNGELSLPKQRNLFIMRLKEMSEQRQAGKIWQWGQLIEVAKDLQLNIGDFYNFIQRLNQDGVLLQKGTKRYAFQGTYI